MKSTETLLARLEEVVKETKQHLGTLSGVRLNALAAELQTARSAAGSAEMVLLIHVYREIDARDRNGVE